MFANPMSGRGLGLRVSEQLDAPLRAAGHELQINTEHASHLTDIRDPDSIHALIIIGGDGTLRAVIERLVQLLGPDRVPPVLFIGLGTANLMQQHLGLTYDSAHFAEQVVRLLATRRTIGVDVSMVNEHLFLLMTSCGLDSEVVKRLAEARIGPITKLSYLMPIVSALAAYHYPNVAVEVDGEVVHSGSPAQVFVGNVAEYGTGFPVLDRASSTDQRLDICVMPCGSIDELVRLMMLTVIGKHHEARGVVYTTGRDVRITTDTPIPLQVDGDSLGTTPARVRLLDKPVAFIVP